MSLDATETLPIIVPANVTIATQNGPIRVSLPASSDPTIGNVAGFQLGGDLAALAPDPAAPITIDGKANSSGIGIGVSPGAGKSASLAYVNVQNTGGHGIAVSNGTLLDRAGVTVSGAGRRSSGATASTSPAASSTSRSTTGRRRARSTTTRQHGIYVTGAGVINITGFPVTVPAPNGQGTVVASGNAFAGLRIFEAPGAAGLSTINGSSPGRTRRTACGSTAARR